MNVFQEVKRLPFSMSEINVAANPSSVFSCQMLKKKQLKVPHTGRAAPIVNESASGCGPEDNRLIRKCQGRRDACGRQLNDQQYMRLRTQGENKDGRKRQCMRETRVQNKL